jgi:hypothetical protein
LIPGRAQAKENLKARSSGLPDVAFASAAWQLCVQAKSGVQEFKEFRSSGVQEFKEFYTRARLDH